MSGAEPQRSAVQYPGGLAARYRWAGSGEGEAVFAAVESGGTLQDLGRLAGDYPDELCRAELRVEGPLGAWTARFASPIYDEPRGLLWDSTGLLVVKYGFRAYAFDGRTGELRWSFASSTPLVAVLASSRLPHVLVQGEIETHALGAEGSVVWRVPHSDVIVDAELVGGRLILAGFDGIYLALDPLTGAQAG